MKTILTILLLSILPCHRCFSEDSFTVIVPDAKGKKILQYSVDESSTGLVVEQTGSLELRFPPTGMTLHPNGKTMIIHGSEKRSDETFYASITSENKKLELISTGMLAQPAGYSSVDRSGRYLLTSHYRSGTLSSYQIREDGSVGKLIQTLKAPNKEAHCILASNDNRYVYVPCVKTNNALYQYSFDQTSGELTPLTPFDAKPPAMFGPRHLAYHPSLPLAYFSNEQQIGVSVYEIGDDGQLTDRQHTTAVARRGPYKKGKRDLNASDVAISSDGKLLFTAMRDFTEEEDSIFSYLIEEDGRLRKIARSKVGDIPWKIDLSPKGHYLIVSESGDEILSFYRIQSDGQLKVSHSIRLPSAIRDMIILL